jgi:hypothetical protein
LAILAKGDCLDASKEAAVVSPTVTTSEQFSGDKVVLERKFLNLSKKRSFDSENSGNYS